MTVVTMHGSYPAVIKDVPNYRENLSITISGPFEKLSDILLGPMSTNNVRALTPNNLHNAAKGRFVGYCKRTMLHMI